MIFIGFIGDHLWQFRGLLCITDHINAFCSVGFTAHTGSYLLISMAVAFESPKSDNAL